jgi:prepilin-type N-terminal cleavage/methylation domain-containing protein/prepilin-type processing-associated H-X9-DG protein
MRQRHAFTLVELLVVIGIIALLVSILLPALNRARESAQRTVCLSNIRQIATAANNYMADNRGVFPFQFGRPGAIFDPMNETPTSWRPNWVHYLRSRYIGNTEKANIPATGYFGGSNRIFVCPAMPNANEKIGARDLQVGYAANGIITHLGGKKIRSRATVIVIREDAIVENASKLRPAWWGPGWPTQPNAEQAGWSGWLYLNTPADPMAGSTPRLTDDPHKIGQNYAFLDGHAEFRRFQDVKARDFGLEYFVGGVWRGDVDEPMLPNYTTPARLGRVRRD